MRVDALLVVAWSRPARRARAARGARRCAGRAARGRGRACRGSAGRAPAWTPRPGRRSRPSRRRGSRTRRRPPGRRRAAGRGAADRGSRCPRRRVSGLVDMRVLPGARRVAQSCLRARPAPRATRCSASHPTRRVTVGHGTATAGRAGPALSPRRGRRGTPATCCCPRSAATGSAGSRPRGCSSSAPAGSARRPCSTSPRRASARSASSTTTSSRPTNLQRQVVHGVRRRRPAQDRVGRGRRARGSTRTSPVVRHDRAPRLGQRARDHRAATTSCSTAPTTSRPATSSTTPACCSGKPHVWGSIFRFDGQVSVWWAEHGPCYRCVFPEPPPPGIGAVVRRGRRARRAVRGDRVGPGDRGDQAADRHRRAAGRAAAGPRRAAPDLGHPDRPQGPRLPRLRRPPRRSRELVDYEEFCGVGPGAAPAVPTVTARRAADALAASAPATARCSSTCAAPTSAPSPASPAPSRSTSTSSARARALAQRAVRPRRRRALQVRRPLGRGGAHPARRRPPRRAQPRRRGAGLGPRRRPEPARVLTVTRAAGLRGGGPRGRRRRSPRAGS